ncbi:MAG: FIST C-terminal domain-containing protein [Synergistaceae bacterium]|nr:FIST C-terminal domain-containing protein [Synergistaceae bacterium]
MFKAKVGSSISASAKTAGMEAAAAAKSGLDSVKMAFVYGSCEYNIDQMMAGVKEVLPGVPALGNTSFTGIITPNGFVGSDDGFVGVMAFSDENMTVGVAAAERGSDPFATGRSVALEAMKNAGKTCAPNFFYMAASPAEEEFYLKGISSVIGRIPFFGGSAADNSIAGKWKLYADGKNFGDGVVTAFFYTDVKMTNLFTGAYRETDDFGVITKVRGNRTLVEIDGVPAMQKYAEWMGCDKSSLLGMDLLVAAIGAPLGVKDRLGDLTAIRHPMNGNEDGSMAIGNNLAEKTCVIRMEATVDELIDSTGSTLRSLIAKMDTKPAAFHLVHCGGRRAGIGDRIGEVAEQIKKAAGDVPFIVEFTFGEYGFESDNNNTCGGLMLSFTGFGK